MSNRRQFIQKLSIGMLAPSLVPNFLTTERTKFKIDSTLPPEDFWKELRKEFPLTQDRVYLNNGTFGPAPAVVVEALKDSIDQIYTSGEYGNFNAERERLAAFVGVKTSELCLTHNTTEGINIMTWGLRLNAGDEVILTTHEHVGNGLPWLNRAKLDGIVIKTFEPRNTQSENFEAIKSLCGSKTKVIAIPHVTCTTGLVFPIKEISQWAKAKGIFTAIDGAHGAGIFDLDLKGLGCDFYAGCYHKWMLGPIGTGFLYVREELLDHLQAIQVGGYSDSGWDITTNPPYIQGYVPTAHRYDYGTQSRPQYVGAAAAADFHEAIGKERVEKRIRELNEYLYEGLKEMSSQLSLLTPNEPESRVAMVSFKPKNKDYQVVAQSLSKIGFRIRQVPESGVNAIRISTHIYNSKEEIDDFVKVLESQLH